MVVTGSDARLRMIKYKRPLEFTAPLCLEPCRNSVAARMEIPIGDVLTALEGMRRVLKHDADSYVG